MIDVHCHLLPGVDDGAPDLETAARMAEMAARDGIDEMILTPHQRHYRWPNEDDGTLAAAFAGLCGRVGSAPRLHLGAEVRVDSELIDELHGDRPGRPLSLAGSRYMLVELDPFGVGPEPEDLVREMRIAGHVPMLAHPERIPWLADDPQRLVALAQGGALMQVTAMSVTGEFGRRAERCCGFLFDVGLAHIVASDAHDCDVRRPALSEARKVVAERWGEPVARHVTEENPRAVVENREIPAMGRLKEAAR